MVLERSRRGKGKKYNEKPWNIILLFNINCSSFLWGSWLLLVSLQRCAFYWPQAAQVEGRLRYMRSPLFVVTKWAISVLQSRMLMTSGRNVHCLCQCLNPDSDARLQLKTAARLLCRGTSCPVQAIFRDDYSCSFVIGVFLFKSPVKQSPSGIVD